MLNQYDISMIGGDLRCCHMAELLLSKNYKVITCCLPSKNTLPSASFAKAMASARIIVCPTPFSRDGIHIFTQQSVQNLSIENLFIHLNKNHILFGGSIPSQVCSFCHQNKIPFYDFMQMKRVSILNTISTAEGTIAEAIKNSTTNLHGSRCLILGYGKCAKILSHKLQGMNASITIAARKKEDCLLAAAYGYNSCPLERLPERISDFEYIFNTIPALILDRSLLIHVSKECTLIDIASCPGGIDYEAAKELGLNASLCLGLPGKYAPKASADILADALIHILKERSD